VADIFPTYFFFSLFPKQSQQQLKCSTTIIMATKINNAMPKIQTTKNIVLFLTTPSLKDVVTSLSNEIKNKKIQEEA
jgi:hypothetical protein